MPSIENIKLRRSIEESIVNHMCNRHGLIESDVREVLDKNDITMDMGVVIREILDEFGIQSDDGITGDTNRR